MLGPRSIALYLVLPRELSVRVGLDKENMASHLGAGSVNQGLNSPLN